MQGFFVLLMFLQLIFFGVYRDYGIHFKFILYSPFLILYHVFLLMRWYQNLQPVSGMTSTKLSPVDVDNNQREFLYIYFLCLNKHDDFSLYKMINFTCFLMEIDQPELYGPCKLLESL